MKPAQLDLSPRSARRSGPGCGQHRVDGYHAGARRRRSRGRTVAGAVVDDDEFVDKLAAIGHQVLADRAADGPDGGFLVAGGETDRDGRLTLGLQSPVEGVEVVVKYG